MKKYKNIIQDGFILLVVSTVFVTVVNQSFKPLKKGGDTDPIVTAVAQGKMDAIQEMLGPKGFEKAKAEYTNLQEFQKARANRADNFGRNPLMWAAYANFSDAKQTLELDAKRVSIVEYLGKSGAALDAQDKDGWTALMWAAWSGMPKVAGKLVELGAAVGTADRQGNTALTIASQRGNVDIVELLASKGADKSAVTKDGKNAGAFAKEGLKRYPEKAEAYNRILSLLGSS